MSLVMRDEAYACDGDDADDDEGQASPIGEAFAVAAELALSQLRRRHAHE